MLYQVQKCSMFFILCVFIFHIFIDRQLVFGVFFLKPTFLARHAMAHVIFMLRAWRPSVCLSVCLSVTLVDCDHTVQQKWNSAHFRIDRCLVYACMPKPTLTWYSVIPSMKTSGVGMENVDFYTSARHPTARVSRYLSIRWSSAAAVCSWWWISSPRVRHSAVWHR